MRFFTILAGIGLCALVSVMPAMADDTATRCKDVTGPAFWNLLPAGNDPYGRVMGASLGDLKGSATAYIVGILPPPSNAVLSAQTVDIWVFNSKDMLFFSGVVVFTPGPTPDALHDDLTLTVTGGTGIYAGATGTVKVVGTAYNLLPPTAAPGQSYADVTYKGNICRAVAH